MESDEIELEMTGPKDQGTQRIRHTLSSGLSFVETAVRNLSSERPNLPQALRLHAVGTQKLREAMTELDRLLERQTSSRKNE